MQMTQQSEAADSERCLKSTIFPFLPSSFINKSNFLINIQISHSLNDGICDDRPANVNINPFEGPMSRCGLIFPIRSIVFDWLNLPTANFCFRKRKKRMKELSPLSSTHDAMHHISRLGNWWRLARMYLWSAFDRQIVNKIDWSTCCTMHRGIGRYRIRSTRLKRQNWFVCHVRGQRTIRFSRSFFHFNHRNSRFEATQSKDGKKRMYSGMREWVKTTKIINK